MSSTEVESPKDIFGELKIKTLLFLIQFECTPSHEDYLGSAWRGLLGWELQDLACPIPNRRTCSSCVIKSHCPSHILIEGQTPIPGLRDSPRGYVLYPKSLAQADQQELLVTLIGNASRFEYIICEAIKRGEQRGIGKGRCKYEVRSMTTTSGKLSDLILFISRGTLSVEILTPLRLRKNGRYLREIEWPFLLETLARRLEALFVLYGDGDQLGMERWKTLSTIFDSLPAPSFAQFRWEDYKRYSTRQSAKIPMGGLVGRAQFDSAPDWLPAWLQVAEVIHVGKGASMGLGKIRISTSSS